MRLLLDTHVLLAVLDGRLATLGRRIEGVFTAGEHTFFVSVASLWEIAIKWRLGKLPLNVPPERLPELLDDMGWASCRSRRRTSSPLLNLNQPPETLSTVSCLRFAEPKSCAWLPSIDPLLTTGSRCTSDVHAGADDPGRRDRRPADAVERRRPALD